MEIENYNQTNQNQNHYFLFNTLLDPTAVHISITANLTNNCNYLIISKLNILEIYLINHTGLSLIIKKKYSTKIEIIEKYKPLKDLNDYLIVLTSSLEIEILKLTNNNLIVIANGKIKDQFGRSAFFGMKSTISFDNKYMVLNAYEQLLKIIHLPQYPKDKFSSSNIKINNSHIVDMTFCSINETIHLAVLSENKKDMRQINTYVFNHLMDIEKGDFNQPNVGSTTSHIIGFVDGIQGLLVLSNETACYFNANKKHVLINMMNYPHTAYTFLNKTDIVLSDSNRNITYLTLSTNLNNEINEIQKRCLKIKLPSIASTMCSLNENGLFVGSLNGNSLICDRNGEIIEEWKNVGSIMDCKQLEGRNDYIICGNGGGKGSIGMMLKGSGIEEIGVFDMEGIENVKYIEFNGHHYLIINLINESKIVEIERKKKQCIVKESGITVGKEKIISCGIIKQQLIFILTNGISVYSKGNVKRLHTFDTLITHAQFYENEGYFIRGKELLKIDETLKIKKLHVFNEFIVSMDINQCIAIGLWNNSLQLLSLKGKIIREYSLYQKIARSIKLDPDSHRLIIGGNDSVMIIDINAMDIDEENTENVLINGPSTDHIKEYSLDNNHSITIKLVYSIPVIISNESYTLQTLGLNPLAVENLVDICESPIGINGVICVTTRGIVFGSMEPMSRVTFKTIQSNENCCSLCINKTKGLLVGKSIKSINLLNGNITNTQIPLKQNEMILCCDVLEDDIYVLGTAIIKETEVEPTSGRILLIKEDNEGLIYIIGEKEYEGAIYKIKYYQKNYIVALINRNIQLIEKEGKELKTKQEVYTNFIGIDLAIDQKTNHIIVADLMKSITIYQNQTDFEHISQIVSGTEIVWSNCLGILSHDDVIDNHSHYILDDIHGNVLLYSISDINQPSEEYSLLLDGQIHIGDSINFIQPSFYKGVIMGGVSGGIYNITEISENDWKLLDEIQRMIVKKGWKSSVHLEKELPLMNCIDGDKLEMIFDWSEKKLNLLAEKLQMQSDELIKRLKDIYLNIFN